MQQYLALVGPCHPTLSGSIENISLLSAVALLTLRCWGAHRVLLGAFLGMFALVMFLVKPTKTKMCVSI